MCHNCKTPIQPVVTDLPVKQRTFGEVVGLEPVVPVVKVLPSEVAEFVDPVTCVDSGNIVERDDATEAANGDFYEDESALTACNRCDGLVPNDETDDNHGYCEECFSNHYTVCYACENCIERRRMTTSEGGDDYCDRC